ncbi:MAG: hypothetical protein JEZ09_13290 [Salinivirgaceae bacterium]|nr:hypothetical protein [Salinivirgaceae bacterium]
MDKNEFLEFLRKSKENIEASRVREQAFFEKLARALQTLVFEQYPEYQSKQNKVSELLHEKSLLCASKVLDALGMAIYNQKNKISFNTKSKIIKPQTREESEKELQELINLYPNADIEYLKQVHWESFYERQRPALFHSCIHNKSKEILVEFYEDDILELSADGLRQIDSTIFYLAVCPFVEDFFECVNLS